MISNELDNCLHVAYVVAKNEHHAYITLEHLMLALLGDSTVIRVLDACAVDTRLLQKQLTAHLTKTLQAVGEKAPVNTLPTSAYQHTLQRAIMAAGLGSNAKSEVTGADVLLTMFREENSTVVTLCGQQGLTRFDVANYMTQGIRKEFSCQVE